MEDIIVSIIIPVYNAENTIEDTCQSIINQSFKHFEVVAIDDGSTDNSLALLKKSLKMMRGLRLFILKTAECAVQEM